MFGSLLYIVGGRYLYEILYANLKLPSPSTILNFISDNENPFIDGKYNYMIYYSSTNTCTLI